MTTSFWPRGGLWRHGDFLKLWSAESISQFGSQVTGLALPLLAVLVLEASAFEVSALFVIEFLPFILFALPAGVWVDRLRRKPILVIADIGRAVLLGSIPLAYLLDALHLGQLYLVGFLVGICTVFFDVSYQSYLPSLVARKQLVEGNSKLEISRSGAQLAGPGAAGGLIGAIGAPAAILLDAISFLVSAVFLFGIRKQEVLPEREEGAPRPSMLREAREGLGYVLGNRYLRPISICTG
ncbi:MAG: MFS transporter, partial [Gaiellaceae bacterium]